VINLALQLKYSSVHSKSCHQPIYWRFSYFSGDLQMSTPAGKDPWKDSRHHSRNCLGFHLMINIKLYMLLSVLTFCSKFKAAGQK